MATSNTNTEIALLKQETQYIKEWVARLEKKQDEQHTLIYNMVKEMRDSMPDKFVTRPEHIDNEKRISELEANKNAVIKWIIVAFIGMVIVITGLNKFML